MFDLFPLAKFLADTNASNAHVGLLSSTTNLTAIKQKRNKMTVLTYYFTPTRQQTEINKERNLSLLPSFSTLGTCSGRRSILVLSLEKESVF
jgi:hypothetical protein